jgi:tetraacyldisaccharide 4'-kinase
MAMDAGWRDTLVAHWQRPTPSLLSRALLPLAWLYGAAAAADRALYQSGLRRTERAACPVVVVGNLVAGGAGKTPTVIALVALLRGLGWRPGVISRGHGRATRDARRVTADSPAEQVGDEPLLIHLRTRAPVAVARQRIDAARLLCGGPDPVDLLVADDGLQHHALARDVQVLVFDERGGGNGLLLPAGPLRERVPDALPARSIVVYNAPRPSTALPGFLATRRLTGAVSLEDWWQGHAADPARLQALRGRPLIACAGMAQPQRFFAMLEQAGLAIERLALPDHEPYRQLPWPGHAGDVVVTEKDAVKLRPGRGAGTRVWVAPLDFRLDAEFGPALARLLPTPPTPRPWTTD